MQFQCDAKSFSAALAAVAPAVERSTTIPILSNVLLQAGGTGVLVVGTDLEIGIRYVLDADKVKPGTLTLPLCRLRDLVNGGGGGLLHVQATEDHWGKISVDGIDAKLGGMSAESFPELPEADLPIGQLSRNELEKAVRLTKFAISQEESRFTLNAALFEFDGPTFLVAATDGHRLSVYETDTGKPFQHKCRILVPKHALALLPKLDATVIGVSAKKEKTEAGLQLNHLFFDGDRQEIVCRNLTGNFPDYHRVLDPLKKTTGSFTVPVEKLKAAAKKLIKFADERSHAARFLAKPDKNTVTLQVKQADVGEFTSDIPATVTQAIDYGLNLAYVLDLVNAVPDAEEITCAYTIADNASLWTSPDYPGFQHALMPMRI